MYSSYVYAHAPTCCDFRNISLEEVRSKLDADKGFAAERPSVAHANAGGEHCKDADGLSGFVLQPKSNPRAHGEHRREIEAAIEIVESLETLLTEVTPIPCRDGPGSSPAREGLHEKLDFVAVVSDSPRPTQDSSEPAGLLGRNLAFDSILNVEAYGSEESYGSPMVPAFHGLRRGRKEDRG